MVRLRPQRWLLLCLLAAGVVACSDSSNPRADRPAIVDVGDDAIADAGGERSKNDGPRADGLGDVGGPDSTSDAAADVFRSDAPLPGNCTACKANEVCISGSCQAAGPSSLSCAAKYPTNLPSGNDGVFYVDASHTGSSDGSIASPFKSISAALAAIPAGKKYTVAVAAGLYDEALTIGVRNFGTAQEESFSADLFCACPDDVQIKQGLTIRRGTLGGTVTVRVVGCHISPQNPPSGATTAAPASSTGWPQCATDDATIGVRGLSGAGTATGGFHVLLRDNVIEGWCTGVIMAGLPAALADSTVCLSRNRLRANKLGVDVERMPQIGLGVFFSECQNATETLALDRNVLDHNQDYAVRLRKQARAISMSANIVELSGTIGGTTVGAGYGVYLGDIDSANLASNVVRSNHNRGIALRNETATVANGVFITNNLVADNRGAGIALQKMQAQKTIDIKGNQVVGTKSLSGEPGGDGIQVSADGAASYNVNISANTVSASTRVGVFFDGVGGNVSNNTVSNSGTYGVYLQQAASASSSNNSYSGNASGNEFSTSNPVLKYGTMPIPPP